MPQSPLHFWAIGPYARVQISEADAHARVNYSRKKCLQPQAVILMLAVLLFALSGCSTHSALNQADAATSLSPGATFNLVSVEDESGHVWEESQKGFDLAQRLKSSISRQLLAAGMAGNEFEIKAIITD